MDAGRHLTRVRRHRQQWPMERIANDLAGFRAACERLMAALPMPDNDASSEWPEHWLDLRFGDPMPQPEKQANQQY